MKKKLIKYIDLILKNEYYTNHGPLTKKIEKMLENESDFKNAITVSNYIISILMVAELFSDKQKFYSDRNIMSKKAIDLLKKKLKYSNQKDKNTINFLSPKKKHSIFEKNNVYLCNRISQIKKNEDKNSISIFNLENNVNDNYTYTGSVIFLNDQFKAEKLRNIRSSYGIRKEFSVYRTCNGRFSEFQSAIYLSNLDSKNN